MRTEKISRVGFFAFIALLLVAMLALFNSSHFLARAAVDTSNASSTSSTTTATTTGTSIGMSMGSSTTSTSSSMSNAPSSLNNATTNGSVASTTYHVMIMKHLCGSNITSLQDFQNLETGKAPIAALANTVLNCPTTGLVGNDAVSNTVASARKDYGFSVSSGSTTKSLTDGTFMSHKLCESDINLDVLMDGIISSSTCLDISHYDIPITKNSSSTLVNITENMQPTGFHFGTIRFTPNDLSPNNDAQNLVGIHATSGTVMLDMKNDTDGMVMLHIYDFKNATSTETTSATTSLASLQDQINALTLRVQALEARIQMLTGAGSGATGSTTPSVSGMGMIDQNNISSKAGGSIDFGGHNFGREEHVFIMMNGNKVGDAFTNSSGGFSSGSMSLPNTPNTSAVYTFTGQSSGITGTATIYLTQ